MPAGLSSAQLAGAMAIIQAYRAHGLNPIGGLAVALNESGLNPAAVGDAGTSYGLFQLHRGGALPRGWSQAQASNPLQNANFAAAQLAHGGHGLSPAALQRYQTLNFERPANPAGDMSSANLARAEQIYAALSGGSAPAGGLGSALPTGGTGSSSSGLSPAVGDLIMAMHNSANAAGSTLGQSPTAAMPKDIAPPPAASGPAPVPVPPPPPPPPATADPGAMGASDQSPTGAPPPQQDPTGYMKQLMGHLGATPDAGAGGIQSLAPKGDALSQSNPESLPPESAAPTSSPQQAATAVSHAATTVGTTGGSQTQNLAVKDAMTQLGVPYQWGGTSPGHGLDCSGLVQYAWKMAGVNIPRTTYEQIAGLPHGPTNPAQWQPGDLIYPESGHVGMFIGNGKIIEAPHTGTVVQIVPVSGAWATPVAVRRP